MEERLYQNEEIYDREKRESFCDEAAKSVSLATEKTVEGDYSSTESLLTQPFLPYSLFRLPSCVFIMIVCLDCDVQSRDKRKKTSGIRITHNNY